MIWEPLCVLSVTIMGGRITSHGNRAVTTNDAQAILVLEHDDITELPTMELFDGPVSGHYCDYKFVGWIDRFEVIPEAVSPDPHVGALPENHQEMTKLVARFTLSLEGGLSDDFVKLPVAGVPISGPLELTPYKAEGATT